MRARRLQPHALPPCSGPTKETSPFRKCGRFLFSNDTDKEQYNDGESHNHALPPCISPTKKKHGDLVHFTTRHKRDITKDTKDQWVPPEPLQNRRTSGFLQNFLSSSWPLIRSTIDDLLHRGGEIEFNTANTTQPLLGGVFYNLLYTMEPNQPKRPPDNRN